MITLDLYNQLYEKVVERAPVFIDACRKVGVTDEEMAKLFADLGKYFTAASKLKSMDDMPSWLMQKKTRALDLKIVKRLIELTKKALGPAAVAAEFGIENRDLVQAATEEMRDNLAPDVSQYEGLDVVGFESEESVSDVDETSEPVDEVIDADAETPPPPPAYAPLLSMEQALAQDRVAEFVMQERARAG
jgi:hypothetical protein